MTTMTTFPASLESTFVPWFQINDELRRFRLFGFNSGFSGDEDVNEVAVDGGGMGADVEGSGFVQQFARVLLTCFFLSIVYVWEESCVRVGGMMRGMFLLLFNSNSTEAITRETRN